MRLYQYVFNGDITHMDVPNLLEYEHFHNVIKKDGFMYTYDNYNDADYDGVIIDLDYNGEHSSYHNYRAKVIPLIRENKIDGLLDV